MERLCGIDCVRQVRYDPEARGRRERVTVLEKGALGVLYGDHDPRLSLRVETTAASEAELELVASYVRRILT